MDAQYVQGLKEAGALRDAGVLTAEEFQFEKEVLARQRDQRRAKSRPVVPPLGDIRSQSLPPGQSPTSPPFQGAFESHIAYYKQPHQQQTVWSWNPGDVVPLH